MKITFLGTGTAIDSYSTTSILVEGKINILLDCGIWSKLKSMQNQDLNIRENC